MGLLIIPLYLASIVVIILAFVKTVRWLRLKKLSPYEVFVGLILSLILFGILALSFIVEGRVYAMSPAFRIPVFMILLPYFGSHFKPDPRNPRIRFYANIALTSVCWSGLITVIFYEMVMDLPARLGVSIYY